MATTIQFKAYIAQFVRNEYNKQSDANKLNEEELNEVLSYKNISENFEYNDLIFTIEVNKNMPKHYAPSILQILKGKGLLFPISYKCL